MTDVQKKSAAAPNSQPTKRQALPISLPGLLLLGPKRDLIACNSEAVNILIYPNKPGKTSDLRALVAAKIPLDKFTTVGGMQTVEFTSGKRRYRCTSHTLEIHGHNPVTTAFLLHRCPSPEVMLCGISTRYNLTARERETTGHLLKGLTSKEIAQQMNISPNTVKAFMRLVMTKMGVTTRAGIVGRMAGVDLEPDHLLGDKRY
jgi:DNA-binding CsgD family transcriptional regulator